MSSRVNEPTQDVLARVYRESSGRIRARLVRMLGDFELAEEVVHDAFAAALTQWPDEGVPREPAAWLMKAAKNKAIDVVRHRVGAAEKLTALGETTPHATSIDDEKHFDGAFDDDLLRLIFTCCHPAIALEGQVALTLQTVCGLRTEEIARAFLVPPTTMAQRLVRAKRKISDAGIPYAVPSASDLADRVHAVCNVVYLVFNEGYAATSGPALVRSDLCVEAIRVGRMLSQLMGERADTLGLLALMLLIDARRETRVDHEGVPILLEDQDRKKWDRKQIEEGEALVRRSLALGATTFGAQAAISAVHAIAPSSRETDWPQIVGLYDALLRLQPMPIVELNRAIAISMVDGCEKGVALLDALAAKGELAEYHLFHAARADLLRRLDRTKEAKKSYERAIELVGNDGERRFLERRLAALAS